MQMLDRILLDKDDWLVSIGLLGAVRVTLKSRNMTLKASSFERSYLLAILRILGERGVRIEPANDQS